MTSATRRRQSLIFLDWMCFSAADGLCGSLPGGVGGPQSGHVALRPHSIRGSTAINGGSRRA
eukprot:5211436-Prorocentrum_lima.AAC.1